MIKIDRYVSPAPEALARLKDDLGVTSHTMAELTGLAQGQQWRKYTGGLAPRALGMHMHFYMAALLTLSDAELEKVMVTMRQQGAEVESGKGPEVTVTPNFSVLRRHRLHAVPRSHTLMSHYYYFAFSHTPDGQSQNFTSATLGLDDPKVTRHVIAYAKQVAGTAEEAFMLSCNYLGEMTSEEFHAGFK
ncbi:hypothetical protein [Pseudomonas viridiflava]|uniref:hypothetical protein n=1 Tax=Pseudomonas viridiflava TaxID=33069 RepID=UPI00197FAA59|nr:hypothetical protein [Pseudomonas viridiflava]